MQSWDAMQSTVNYEQHNSWYNSMFSAANIKTEPGTTSPPLHTPTATAAAAPTTAPSQLESYLKQHAVQQQLAPMDSMSALTPSPSNNDSMQHFFESNMQQQLLQQQQYQQQFQQAQQAAAQNQLTSTQLPLGFNPLTPPGLPTAVLPSMTHFYNNQTTHTHLRQHGQQTPSPQPAQVAATPSDAAEKMQCALTPRNTPPMDITPPKSPKANVNNIANTNNSGAPRPESIAALEHDQDLISNSSEDLKYLGESELDDDESIRMPIYNSHGKMKHYKCKTCGLVAYTKIAFWEHVRSHMKPEKILQCPKCPFVTELKHHLEYHIRKHKNLKPFQCDKCSYTCVNKSMLNSHRKSHSSVYQYRCSDCDYATKYCHSFKLHLRKYDHKPGMVLDEEGVPNPSVVIDVYGTRRGPKAKSGGHVAGGKRERLSSNNLAHQQQTHNAELNVPSHLSAALQGFPMAKQHQMPASPAKSNSSVNSDLPAIKLNMALQQQQQQQQQQQTQSQSIAPQAAPPQASMSNLLPPLASILQQNRNMAFFPYWNLNLQVLAAQQQAAVLAQLSPRMRETTLQQLQQQQSQQHDADSAHGEEDDDDDDEEFERKSIDSAMDLSQGTPTKEEQQQQQTPAVEAMNLKLQEDTHDATPLISSNSSSRRKGRVLKLDTLLQVKCASQSPEQSAKTLTTAMPANKSDMPAASSPINKLALATGANTDEDECMEPTNTAAANSSSANTSATSTASSSSGNSSNSSNSNSNGPNGTGAPAGAIYECKYCDIYFKDAVLYTIHMGYHSCDDVFKCNMCGEKCDGPVGLFVHMARNAHS